MNPASKSSGLTFVFVFWSIALTAVAVLTLWWVLELVVYHPFQPGPQSRLQDLHSGMILPMACLAMACGALSFSIRRRSRPSFRLSLLTTMLALWSLSGFLIYTGHDTKIHAVDIWADVPGFYSTLGSLFMVIGGFSAILGSALVPIWINENANERRLDTTTVRGPEDVRSD